MVLYSPFLLYFLSFNSIFSYITPASYPKHELGKKYQFFVSNGQLLLFKNRMEQNINFIHDLSIYSSSPKHNDIHILPHAMKKIFNNIVSKITFAELFAIL